MADIIIPQVAVKGMSKGALRGPLNCVYCDNSTHWKFVNKPGPYQARYRCGKCKHTLIYDFANSDKHPHGLSPYRNLVK